MPSRSMFDHPIELLQFATTLQQNGREEHAVDLALQALNQRPDDRELVASARAILLQDVPNYHRAMLTDVPRNNAYLAMINREVPGKRVLDIGTGTGLLAMMAARAGAEHVYACETNTTKASLAKDIIAKHGLSDRITLLNTHSTKLDRDKHLGGGVDAVISEVFSSNVVGEMVVESLSHAQAELALPGAVYLPPKVTIMGALAEYDDDVAIDDVAGFDLSLLNRRLAHYAMLSVENSAPHQRGPAQELCEISFVGDAPFKLRDRNIATLGSNGGRVTGLLTWMRIDFGDGMLYENQPGGDRRCHWPVRIESMIDPRETKDGDQIRVGCAYGAGQLILWDATES